MNIEEELIELSKKGEAAHFHADGHWDVYLNEDGSCSFNYYCCDYEECNSSDYEHYENVEQLIENENPEQYNWTRID